MKPEAVPLRGSAAVSAWPRLWHPREESESESESELESASESESGSESGYDRRRQGGR